MATVHSPFALRVFALARYLREDEASGSNGREEGWSEDSFGVLTGGS